MDTPAEKSTRDRIDEWQQQQQRLLQMGGEKAI